MKVYKILYNQAYENWGYKKEEDILFLHRQFRGKEFPDMDHIIKVETTFKGELAEQGEISDIANVAVVPVFKTKAKQIVEPFINDIVQWVPFEHNVYGTCYAMNALTVIDCVDEKRCTITLAQGIVKYVMKRKNIEFPLVFKIPNYKSIGLFATEDFKNIIEEKDLKGLAFRLIWDSDN